MMPSQMVTTIADFVVDLSRFPGGSRINVSFAYVTEESGLSPYSDPTGIQPPGMIHNPFYNNNCSVQKNALSGN